MLHVFVRFLLYLLLLLCMYPGVNKELNHIRMINLLYFNISAKGLFQKKTCTFFLKKAFGRNIEIE